MVELIQQLLLKNNCVIIPNFGAFIGNYNPSEIRLMENKIFPPSKIIAFNRSLQNNDGLLINAVAHQFAVSYHDAEMEVTSFAKQCNDSLAHNKSLILKEIGRFSLDAENKIQFQPYYSKNYLLDSFGLSAMQIQPIQRLKDAEADIKETYQRILHPERMEDAVATKQAASKAAYWFTAILAVSFLGASLFMNLQKSETYQNQSSLLPAFSTIKSEGNKQEVIPAATEQSPINTTSPQILKEVVVASVKSVSKNKSYIVIGAFFDEIRANKLKAEAEAKGYIVNVAKEDANGLFRTTVLVENEDVENSLQKIKSEINQRAWIYCIKCNLN
jgi:nucleoid DNA-binding protein